jgi:hypothetical protein
VDPPALNLVPLRSLPALPHRLRYERSTIARVAERQTRRT